MPENDGRSYRRWTAEETAFLQENWHLPLEDICMRLDRTVQAVQQRGYSMGLYRRRWTPKEEEYLQENWGKYSIPAIAKKLGKSVNAIKVRANRLALGPVLMGGDYVTLNQLTLAVSGGAKTYSYKMISWVNNRGLPVHTKKVLNNSFRVVYLDEFWEWAEKNRSFLDFSKLEPLSLGAEPSWVAEQRRKDFQAFAIQRKDPWTPDEDNRLKTLLKQHKYGYAELSEKLRRSAGAIQRRCTDLGIKERPVKADNHSEDSKWTDSDFEILAEGIRRGDSYTQIGRMLGKSEKAVRGKVYFVYLTENADKVRAMMGDNSWGGGAPVPTVKQAIHLSRTRTATKAELERLAGVLYRRTLELKKTDYDRYFQRAMCMNWNELDSCCAANCEDCDSCTEFVRIQPQYCVRCGATFYERAGNRICARCRAARRKQAYRKYQHLYGGKRNG